MSIRKNVIFSTRDGRTVTLRPFTSSDVDALLRFANSIVREKKENRDLGIAAFDKRLTRGLEKKFLRATLASVRKRSGVSIAAFAGRTLVGECMVRGREPNDLKHTGLLGIVILSEYRGVGLGETLMLEVLREAKRIGIWLVELEVMAINKGAIQLYEKLGFRKVGTVPNKVQRDGRHLDMVTMYVDLRETINPP